MDFSKSKDKRDFGRGFYTTAIRKQAENWADSLFDRYRGDGIFVYEIEFNYHFILISQFLISPCYGSTHYER
ncbi:MAG: DUF3990 domain-containing protein [Treponema sp.]|nr:DUF3990 domain-containing protein [Treponema sp.]